MKCALCNLQGKIKHMEYMKIDETPHKVPAHKHCKTAYAFTRRILKSINRETKTKEVD